MRGLGGLGVRGACGLVCGGAAGFAWCAGLLHELVQRQVKQVAAGAAVHQHFAGAGVDVLHGVQIHALARDLRRFLVLGQHGGKALGVAFGLGGDAGLVAFSFLREAGGGAFGAGHHVVGVGLRQVFGALAFLVGLVHVVKRGFHLLGRLRAALLHVHGDDFNADAVAVQDFLGQLAHAGGDLVALFRQGSVHLHVAQHFAHGAFAGLAKGVVGELAFKQVGARVAQAVLHGELDFDDVFVGREHGRGAQASGGDDDVAAHIDRSDLRDIDGFLPLNGPGQPPVQARVHHGGVVPAELGDDGVLPFLHDEKARAQPHERGCARQQGQARARAAGRNR